MTEEKLVEEGSARSLNFLEEIINESIDRGENGYKPVSRRNRTDIFT